VDTTVSPRIKLFALVGGLGAAALAAGMFFLSRTPSVDSTPIPPPARIHTGDRTVAATTKPKRRATPAATRSRFDVVLAKTLARRRVVVVSVYAGDADVDRVAHDEALAGARDAHAGFVRVDVSNKAAARALTAQVKQLTAPDILVFARGRGLVTRFHGIADRALVAQLAASAR
jgi:hypothetical protein